MWAALALSTGEAASLPPAVQATAVVPARPEPLRGAISLETFVHREHVRCLLTQRPENGFVLFGCLRGPRPELALTVIFPPGPAALPVTRPAERRSP